MTNPIICPNCEGDGERENRKGETVECVSCKGEGVLRGEAQPIPSVPHYPLPQQPLQIYPHSPGWPWDGTWCGDDVKTTIIHGSATGEAMRL